MPLLFVVFKLSGFFYQQTKQIKTKQKTKEGKISNLLCFVCLFVCLFVLVKRFTNNMIYIYSCVILVSPSSVYAMKFAIHCYEAFAFLIFQKLITLYLGGPENALKLMAGYPPKKIWAAFPLCCCWIFCYPCIPHVHLSISTFRHLYVMVLQFVFLMPFLAFLEVIIGYTNHDETFLRVLMGIRLSSIVMCVYALIVYMRAASEPLLEYRARGKFWVMKLTVIAASFIETAIGLGRHVKEFEDGYTEEVMRSAWGAVISCVFMVPLAMFVRRVFGPKDCDLTRPVHVLQDTPHIASMLDLASAVPNLGNGTRGPHNGGGYGSNASGFDTSNFEMIQPNETNETNETKNRTNTNTSRLSNDTNPSIIKLDHSDNASELESRQSRHASSVTFHLSKDDT